MTTVTLGRGCLSEEPGCRARLQEQMLRASRLLGRLLQDPGREQPFEALAPSVSIRCRELLRNLACKTSEEWFDEVHGATAEYAQYVSAFPPALHPILQLLYFEPVLYAEPTGKWYKDHIVHQLRVTRLLFLLIKTWRSGPGRDHSISGEVLYPAALLAGLFHDVGYPLALLRELSDNPYQTHWEAKYEFSFDRIAYAVDVSRIGQCLRTFNITHDPVGWIRKEVAKGGTKVHAYLSGLWLLGFRDEIRKRCREPGALSGFSGDVSAQKRLDEIFDHAAAAAFFHHLHEHKGLGFRLVPRLADHPLVVLLQLADTFAGVGAPHHGPRCERPLGASRTDGASHPLRGRSHCPTRGGLKPPASAGGFSILRASGLVRGRASEPTIRLAPALASERGEHRGRLSA